MCSAGLHCFKRFLPPGEGLSPFLEVRVAVVLIRMESFTCQTSEALDFDERVSREVTTVLGKRVARAIVVLG